MLRVLPLQATRVSFRGCLLVITSRSTRSIIESTRGSPAGPTGGGGGSAGGGGSGGGGGAAAGGGGAGLRVIVSFSICPARNVTSRSNAVMASPVKRSL